MKVCKWWSGRNSYLLLILIFQNLLEITDSPDGLQNNLRSASYEALMKIAKNSTKYYYPSVQKLTLTTLTAKSVSIEIQSHIKTLLGLPWWRSSWESACQCRGQGLEPWSGKIPRAAEQLGPWATTTEPARLEPVLRKKRGRNSERPAHRDEEWSLHRDEEWPPLATTGESPRTETKTQHSHK